MDPHLLQTVLPYIVFKGLNDAAEAGYPIRKPHARDKEDAFQSWVERNISKVLTALPGIELRAQGRNTFPDLLVIEAHTGRPIQGYEVKGLATPGRAESFDANSELPTGRVRRPDGTVFDVYYVFGRYPKTTELEYPLVDFVVFHGDLINADTWYRHKNFHIKGFGSYGDIMIRDRKMYVPKTPYAILSGIEGKRILVVPHHIRLGRAPLVKGIETLLPKLIEVGDIERVEAEERIIAYKVCLEDPSIEVITAPNPSRGKKHRFVAYAPVVLVKQYGPFKVTIAQENAG